MTGRRVRQIVQIDEDKCDGCGLCVPACEEGAIQIIDGKARLVADRYCDGLGACLGECPQGAITLQEREADEFDEEAVAEYLADEQASTAQDAKLPCGCPSAQARTLEPCSHDEAAASAPTVSRLRNWPVQLTLVSPTAPWLDGADLLLCADCVPFALGDFHRDLLEGKQLIIACPKLDDIRPYLAKLTEIFESRDVRSVTVARMEVPCCSGLVGLARRAVQAAGKHLPVQELVVGIEGHVLEAVHS